MAMADLGGGELALPGSDCYAVRQSEGTEGTDTLEFGCAVERVTLALINVGHQAALSSTATGVIS